MISNEDMMNKYVNKYVNNYDEIKENVSQLLTTVSNLNHPDEILSEKSTEPQDALMRKFIYKDSVIHSPEKIKKIKSLLPDSKFFFTNIEKRAIDVCKERQCLGMGENVVIYSDEPLKPILYTYGIADCVGLAIYDSSVSGASETQMNPRKAQAGLFHFSKMNFINELEMFLEKFDPKTCTVHLISVYYSPDLIRVATTLHEKGFKIDGCNVYDCYTSMELKTNTVYVDKNTVPSLFLKALTTQEFSIKTDFVLDSKSGKIGFFDLPGFEPEKNEVKKPITHAFDKISEKKSSEDNVPTETSQTKISDKPPNSEF